MKSRADEIASVIREQIGRYREELTRRREGAQKTDDLSELIRREVDRYRGELDVQNVGRVLEVGDGIAQIYGLSGAMAGEMLEFENGQLGQVFNLEDRSIGAVIYGRTEEIKAGESVRATGHLLSVPVDERMIGRVIDPLGRPLDGGQPIEGAQRRPLELPAPGIAARQPVDEPLQTGIKAIDAMTPIGRGQRELIIGDRKTGKTAIAIDAIINQKDTGVLCIYVAIGQKESTVAGTVEILRQCGAMGHTVVVAASSSDPAPLQYIAPYAGCTIGEHFMYEQGRAVLIVYDDLSKQAAAYREVSLLLRRPPGREAYPGDVFYLHSRLLERACKLADQYVIVPASTPAEMNLVPAGQKAYIGPPGLKGAKEDLKKLPDADKMKVHRLPTSGGSMTALPICETQAGEVSAYIPTNLISITDGQVYLEPGLFFAGVRPAINAGISVSRVGYKAAVPVMKKAAAGLRMDLAAYRELQAYTQVSMSVDTATQRQLDRGERLVKLSIQPQYRPMHVVDQALSLYAATRGYLDVLPVERVAQYERDMLAYMKEKHADFYAAMRRDQSLPADREQQLRAILDEFAQASRTASDKGPA